MSMADEIRHSLNTCSVCRHKNDVVLSDFLAFSSYSVFDIETLRGCLLNEMLAVKQLFVRVLLYNRTTGQVLAYPDISN